MKIILSNYKKLILINILIISITLPILEIDIRFRSELVYYSEKVYDDTPLSAGPLGYVIHIDNNWSETKIAYSWCTGNGIDSDPYIINDIEVDANGDKGIWIGNSTDFFVIQNCTAYGSGPSGYQAGIIMENVTNGKIIKNYLSNNQGTGLTLINCFNNTIENNTAHYNTYSAIQLGSSNYNVIQNNDAGRSILYGIYLSNSSFNNITGNNANKGDGLQDKGILLISNSENNLIKNNTASGNDEYGIHLYIESNNNTVSNNTVESNDDNGILVQRYCEYNIIDSNFVAGNTNYGIFLWEDCDNNIIFNNTVTNHGFHGIVSQGFSGGTNDFNRIIKNKVSFSSYYGIYLWSYTRNHTVENNIAYNNSMGICILGPMTTYSNYNEIIHNIVFNNSEGIHIDAFSQYNLVFENIVINNSDFGISINYGLSKYNLIYRNILISNTIPARDRGVDNDWNNATHGNYWDIYSGVDIDEDGVGDTNYSFDDFAVDYFPLMQIPEFDSDNDTLTDYFEFTGIQNPFGNLPTDPFDEDSDNDRFNDGVEIDTLTNPLDRWDFPKAELDLFFKIVLDNLLTIQFINRGNWHANEVKFQVNITSIDLILFDNSQTLANMAVNETVEIVINFLYFQDQIAFGKHNITIFIDPNNQIEETNEDNNIFEFEWESTRIDLVINNYTLTCTNLTLEVKNSGIWGVNNVVVLAKITDINLTLYNNSVIPFNFTSNENVEIFIDFLDFQDEIICGNTYNISIYLDPDNSINETAENNNFISLEWECQEPDLIIYYSNITNTNLTLIFKNTGNWTAIDVLIHVNITNIPLLIYNNSLNTISLAPGESYQIFINFSDFDLVLIKGADYIVSVSVDPDDSIEENNELNNYLDGLLFTYPEENESTNNLINILSILTAIIIVFGIFYALYKSRKTKNKMFTFEEQEDGNK
jgi:parallel beta-helix repeat protein